MNPTADDLGLEAERFHRKVAAGARFAMTQILFDLEALDAFRERLGGWPIPVLRRRLADPHDRDARARPQRGAGNRRPRARAGAVPLGRCRRARGRTRARAELIEGARELASGAYVMAPFRRPLDVVELLPEPG